MPFEKANDRVQLPIGAPELTTSKGEAMPASKNRASRRRMQSASNTKVKSLNRSGAIYLEAAAREILVDTTDIVLLSNEDPAQFEDVRKAFARHYAGIVRAAGTHVKVSA